MLKFDCMNGATELIVAMLLGLAEQCLHTDHDAYEQADLITFSTYVWLHIVGLPSACCPYP